MVVQIGDGRREQGTRTRRADAVAIALIVRDRSRYITSPSIKMKHC
jgi:hypothetical protein